MKKIEEERDKALGEVSSLASVKDEAEKKVLKLQISSSQLGESQKKVEALQTKVNELEARISELEKESDNAKTEAKESVGMALGLTIVAFKNSVDQVIALNPGAKLCMKHVNPDYVVLDGNLVELTSKEGAKYEIRVQPG